MHKTSNKLHNTKHETKKEDSEIDRRKTSRDIGKQHNNIFPMINCPDILTARSAVRYLSNDLINGNKTKNLWSKIKYVTTKTAGERGVLICEYASGRCRLHMDSGVEIELSKPMTCAGICGFALDVEVIKCPKTSMPSLIVAFDML